MYRDRNASNPMFLSDSVHLAVPRPIHSSYSTSNGLVYRGSVSIFNGLIAGIVHIVANERAKKT
ncbi:hypothetical protein BDQ12DRAFT_688857 [Crucibulum laeve]|uniref:Uncharacterized protein n=1 Tax=Crucibulum laeve TaxID=68775 RepID=A0A5C3LPK2_9AGAR|nr:hypothetical protein BDQ12DRAFT_688857 [Crucibulum laeve]